MPELTANGRPVPGGFAGTVPAFVDWLQEQLAYGGASVSEPVPDGTRAHPLVREVRLVTAGYSDDEALLGRVRRGSMFSMRFWESDHRGGLSVYRVPVEAFDAPEPVQWLGEPTDVFEEVWRARRLVIDLQDASHAFDLPAGARLRFAEPGRDVCAPAGVLTVEEIPAEEAAGLFEPPAPPEGGETTADLLEELLGPHHDD